MTKGDLWSAGAIIALGAVFGAIAMHQARSRTPDPRYASRAGRLILWLFSLGLIWMGLGFFWGKDYLGVAALFFLAALAWLVVLVLGPIVAPRWIARIWLHPENVALAVQLGRPIPSLAESEREARRFGHGMVAFMIIAWTGYYLYTRWFGIWLLPLVYVVAVTIAAHRVFWPRRRQATRP